MNNQFVMVALNKLSRGWVETDSKDNALATAAKSAAFRKTHIITGAYASFSATTEGLLQIKDGTDVIFETYVYDSADIPLNIQAITGNAVSAELAASGTAGTIGKVNLTGYTV